MSARPAPYVPLWTKSNFSFLEGASHPGELVERARELGCPALALTDRDGVYGAVRAHVRAQELDGFPLILGAELTVVRDLDRAGPLPPKPSPPRAVPPDDQGRVVLLAQDRRGWATLCRLLSAGRARCPKGQSRLSLAEVQALGAQGGLHALCPHPAFVGPLREAFPRDALHALVARHRDEDAIPLERRLRGEAAAADVPLVGTVEVLYHHRGRRPLQDVVSCLRFGRTLQQAGDAIQGNAERVLLTQEEMADLYRDDPILIHRTQEVADRCAFRLDQIRYRYPAEHVPEGTSERDWLRRLTFEGADRRYPHGVPPDVRAQLDRELGLIEELDYGGYFVTMFEIVRFCREQGILCQGRGSAANSAVCYCLGITAIDPVRMDLLFERFISRERAEPPDIDLDIEHERREEVIQHVYDKYGRRRAAMVANVIRYRARSAVRDVGKVLGIPETELDGVARQLSYFDPNLPEDTLRNAGLDPNARGTRLLFELANQILDFPRHLSIHPGGFLLGHEPVDTLVPIEPATMEDRTVIQWDKQDVDDLGLFKVDLLGLGALTAIHRTFDLLTRHEGRRLEIATVPAEDPDTYAMVSDAETIGVFQIESRAQQAMLPRLRPKTFYDLVVEVAIVRPGPIQGDMVHPYLRRRSGEEPVTYPHPSLERVLGKTLGVPIFQEQVMKLAVLAAGYSPGEADRLRRDMAAWRSSGRIEQHRDRIVQAMIARGIASEFAERVFSQIRGFGEYGFPESHAASFALLAYVTAWLRCHHLPAFICGLLNAQPMGFYSPSTLLEDVKRRGVEVRPVDVRHSGWDCDLEPASRAARWPWAIRLGYRFLQGFGERERARLAAEPPPYVDLWDFALRTRLSKRALVTLAEVGAFDGFEVSRRDALWKVRALADHARDSLATPAVDSGTTFPALGPDEEVLWDVRASAMSPRGHLMDRFRDALAARGLPTAEQVRAAGDGARATYVGMVICRQRPASASGVTFFTLEDETGHVNVVLWRDTFDRYALVAKTASLLGVRGKLQSQHGVVHLVADHLWIPDDLRAEAVQARKPTDDTPPGDRVTLPSRNFH